MENCIIPSDELEGDQGNPGLPLLEAIEKCIASRASKDSYVAVHAKRFSKTFRLVGDLNNKSVLDVGRTDVSIDVIMETSQVTVLHVTNYGDRYSNEVIKTANGRTVVQHNMDLERHGFGLPNEYFDTIIMGEVLEHFEIDPMYALNELNRVQKIGGRLILTTPNACSTRNLNKMIHGYRPHFFMQYSSAGILGRHNFEHDIHSVSTLVESAGYDILELGTWDVFEEKAEVCIPGIADHPAFNQGFRGDDIYCMAIKQRSPTVRFPANVYYDG